MNRGINSICMLSLQSLISFLSQLIFLYSRWEKIMAMGECSMKENIFSMVTFINYDQLLQVAVLMVVVVLL